MLPIFVVRNAVHAGELKPLNIKTSDMHQWSQFVYLKGKAITPQLQMFIDTVQELLPPVQTEPSKL